MARYKRNHDYLSEIFTPYNACKLHPSNILLILTLFVASITPAALDFSQTKEELEKQIVKINDTYDSCVLTFFFFLLIERIYREISETKDRTR